MHKVGVKMRLQDRTNQMLTAIRMKIQESFLFYLKLISLQSRGNTSKNLNFFFRS